MPRVTYASTNDDLKYLLDLGVPMENVADRMGRSPDAVYFMVTVDNEGNGATTWAPLTRGF